MANTQNGQLTIYVDCVSPYSWFGFTNTMNFRSLLNAHGISVDVIPFFLGASRVNMGNPFTPTPKHRDAFGAQDLELTGKLLGLKVARPKEFPVSSLFAVRVALWVKDHYPADKFDATFPAFSTAYWSKGMNISKPEVISQVLGEIFPAEDVKKILDGAVTPENKKRVMDVTLGAQAFGAPWIVAVNRDGDRREWFGNDRWEQVFDHLKISYTPLQIDPPTARQGEAKL